MLATYTKIWMACPSYFIVHTVRTRDSHNVNIKLLTSVGLTQGHPNKLISQLYCHISMWVSVYNMIADCLYSWSLGTFIVYTRKWVIISPSPLIDQFSLLSQCGELLLLWYSAVAMVPCCYSFSVLQGHTASSGSGDLVTRGCHEMKSSMLYIET